MFAIDDTPVPGSRELVVGQASIALTGSDGLPAVTNDAVVFQAHPHLNVAIRQDAKRSVARHRIPLMSRDRVACRLMNLLLTERAPLPRASGDARSIKLLQAVGARPATGTTLAAISVGSSRSTQQA